MATTNQTNLVIGVESSVGVPPGSPTGLKVPLRGEDLANPLNFDPSGEFRDDRLTTRYDLISEDAAGGIDINFRYDVSDFLLEGAFVDVFGAAPTRNNAESATDITDITTTTLTVASGAAFVENSLVLLEGNTDAGNNVLVTAASGSDATTLVTAGGLTADGSPAATSRATTVGIVGASGDFVAVSDGITCTAESFTNFPFLKKDVWIKIGGTATGDKFTNQPQDNTWAKIALVEAKKLTLTNLPSTWAADTGTGKTIKIWTSELITIGDGTLKQSYFLQKKIPVSGGTRYLKVYGAHIGLFRVDVAARGRITARFDFQGTRGEFDSTAIVGSPSTIGRHPFLDAPRRPFVSGRSIARIHEGADPFASGTFCLPNVAFALQNQLLPVSCVQTLGYEDFEYGEALTSQSGNINLRTASVYEKYRGETESRLSCIMVQDQQAYVIDSPRGIFTTSSITLPGPNQLVQIPFTFTADENVEGNSGANNKQYGMARFRYYEA